jgi:hypothetical protein
MKIFPLVWIRRNASCRFGIAAGAAALLVSLGVLSAHSVRGLASPAAVGAFVASPTATPDEQPIPIRWGAADTGLQVFCFLAANTSMANPDRPGWPRITGIGFELPGNPQGFSLLAPLDGDWRLVEGTTAALPDHGTVSLDFAIVANVNPTGRTPGRPDDPRGIPPGQKPERLGALRFCVSGPFPATLPIVGATTIERLINGVVVEFDGIEGNRRSTDAGVWHPTPSVPRAIPLYP